MNLPYTRLTYTGGYLFPRLCRIYNWSKTSSLSKEAIVRLKWFDWYRVHGENASLTCRHFGISRKTFYKWFNRFDRHNLVSLESQDRAPKRKRQPEITPLQEMRIIELRKKYIRYGKEKIAFLYQQAYQERISSWKIQRVIQRHKIYWHPKKTEAIRRKRQRSQAKKRITELKQKRISGFLLCLDVIVYYWNGFKRYIFTGIDRWSKLAFARMYTTKSSYNARDFLLRLDYLLEGKISNLQTDNGSEFQKYFERTRQKLKINHYFSRTRTPKDNATNERFNRTLQEEFIQQGNFTPDLKLFNRNLTEWLIEYNFRRPHQALGYIPPINFQAKYLKVLPMYPSSTKA